MPTDEILRKSHEESDSEEDEELETVSKVDIDVSKLTPLSPEVISKQVSTDRLCLSPLFLRNIFRLQ
jgi:translation initiation factor 2 subunit 3